MPRDAILAFDTSAAHCAAALIWQGGLVQRAEPMDKGQAERLMPMLAEMLAEAGLEWHDLAALGVGIGPGNFTGVRISVAAARGLALGLGIPAHGVSRLEALAYGLERPISVVEDARRGEVYVQDFGVDGVSPARIGPAETMPVAHARRTGSASDRPDGAGQISSAMPPSMPLAEAMARIVAERIAAGVVADRPAPFYLRSADAAPPSDPPPVILP